MESTIFLATQALGVYVAYDVLSKMHVEMAGAASSIFSFLIAFGFATGVLLLLLKFLKGRLFFKLMLAFLVFLGSETVFSTFFPEEAAFLLAIELVLLRFLRPTVMVQNVVLLLAMAGIGSTLGIIMPISAVVVIMIVLSAYDFIAVYKTKHMLSMFKDLMGKGIPMSIVVPDKVRDMNSSVKDAKPGEGKFIMLGTGDIAFPLILAVSALRTSILASVFVVAGSLFGLLLVHVILMRKGRGAIPALPPITLGSLLGLLAAFLVTGGVL